MAAVKQNRQKYHRTENSFETDFILPAKTNNAIRIVAPPFKSSNVVTSPAFGNDDSARSNNGSNDSPSQEASLFVPPRKEGKTKLLDESSGQITPLASEQVPKEAILRKSLGHSSVSHSQSPQPGGGHHTPLIAPASQSVAESILDIYANSYIPMWQTAINEAPASPRHCRPLSTIDYATYINSFAGHRTLSTVAPIRLPPIHTVPFRIRSLPEALLPQQYTEYFSDALQNEIAAQFEEMKTFSMYNVPFEVEDHSQHLYRFRIPGLREHSPRVDLGDVVKIRPLTAPPPQPNFWERQRNLEPTPAFSGFEFCAIVWEISRPKERIVLRMDGFMPNLWRACNIIFAVQEHRCAPLWRNIDLTARLLNGINDFSSPWLRQMLFPDESYAKLQSTLSRGDFDLNWFDLQMNFEQQKATDAVVTANYGCVPYLISGPPGTGKTKTIVETTLQLLQSETHGPTPHLLVCAPSDPAADTLATRLSAHLDPRSMLRLNGWTRSFAEVPGNLLPYTNAENNLFSLPDFETMMSYKVVVTTCRDAYMLVQARLTNEALIHLAKKSLSAIAPNFSKSIDPSQLIHWTALLLDEAAQAIEPEVLIPISVVDPASSLAATGALSTEWNYPVPQIVMAGDEYQLGPRLSLKSASPLSTSLFARLFARPLYSAHPLSRANGSKRLTSAMLPMLRPSFTNLIRNYRSHPAILTVPSILFYADTLIAECTTLSEIVRTWPGWQKPASLFGSDRVAVANSDAEDIESSSSRRWISACWPVLFVNNSGSDALESILAGNGTGAGGLFNASEADIALNVVKGLLSHSLPLLPTESMQGGLPNPRSGHNPLTRVVNLELIRPGEIVVMSPFRAQVNYLRKNFRQAGLYDVNIGPLEAFQGLESRIVILCTTRTRVGTDDQGRDRFVREDQARGLGVIGEQKKFNVAITRAKEGLIVIGNQKCLTSTNDEAWVEFLAFCWRNGTDRSISEIAQQPSVSHTPQQGRLERALRYAENLARSRRKAADGDDSVGSDGVTGRLSTGFGYPSHQKSSRNRLRGNMPSLDEDMFREGLRIADDMGNSAEDDMMYSEVDYEELGSHDKHDDAADFLVNNARELRAIDVHPELSREDALFPTTSAGNGEATTPHIQSPPKAAGSHSETLIDIRNTLVAGADIATKVSREALSGMQSGSFKKPAPTSTGNTIVQESENLDLHEKKKVKDFDLDPVAEFERTDCVTQ